MLNWSRDLNGLPFISDTMLFSNNGLNRGFETRFHQSIIQKILWMGFKFFLNQNEVFFE